MVTWSEGSEERPRFDPARSFILGKCKCGAAYSRCTLDEPPFCLACIRANRHAGGVYKTTLRGAQTILPPELTEVEIRARMPLFRLFSDKVDTWYFAPDRPSDGTLIFWSCVVGFILGLGACVLYGLSIR